MQLNLRAAIKLCLVAGVIVLVAAQIGRLPVAQAQPEKRVENLNALVGTWRGERKNPQGQVMPVTLTIRENGVLDAYTPLAIMFAGKLTLAGGKMSYRASNGSGGPVTLHEDNQGKRLLRFTDTAASPPETAEYERQ